MALFWQGDLPWHPFWVHFPLALWVTGSGILLVCLVARKPGWVDFAWSLLALAAVLAIPAAITGQHELDRLSGELSSTMERHRDLGVLLPWLMGALVLLSLHFRLRAKALKVPLWIWCILTLIIAALILYTGYLGGVLVYAEGVGAR